MKYKYKNISGQKQAVIGFGEVEPEKTIETNKPINNPKFELVADKKSVAKKTK